jgi:hypothetical protein
LASTDASTTINGAPLLVEVGDGAVEAYPATVATGDPCEHVVHGGPRCQPRELSGEILLEGLPGRLGAALETCVHFIWEIAHQNIRHAFILLSHRQQRNPPSRVKA